MSLYAPSSARLLTQAHTIQEFILLGQNSNDNTSYRALSYIETRDEAIEFTIKIAIDDYLPILKENALTIKLSDSDIRTYRYNPKMLSYKLYGSTKLYYVILRMNDMCNVHEFSLSNGSLLLLAPDVMADSMSSIYKSEEFSISKYNNNHKFDITPDIIEPYRDKWHLKSV